MSSLSLSLHGKSRNRKSHYPLSKMNCMSARKTNVLFCSMYAFTYTTIKSCVVTMAILLNFVTLFISIPLHSHTHVVIKRSVIHSCQSEPQGFTSSNCKKCDYSVIVLLLSNLLSSYALAYRIAYMHINSNTHTVVVRDSYRNIPTIYNNIYSQHIQM